MPGHRTVRDSAVWDARLSEPGSPVCTPDWLALREPADAAARSTELADRVAAHLGTGPVVVRDLGCGTGSMGRWLAPRLPGPPQHRAQRWILHDRDPVLLARAAAHPPAAAGVETVCADLADADLAAADLAGTDLVTASALLDLLTAEEVDVLAAACAAAGCAALLTLTVAGHVVLYPPDALDGEFAAAFDAHQRRTVDGRWLLGPDAPAAAAEAFRARGATVLTRPTPWRLGPEHAELTEEWLRGWIGAAVAQRPGLAPVAPAYLQRRLADPLRVEVGHVDVLALPGGAS